MSLCDFDHDIENLIAEDEAMQAGAPEDLQTSTAAADDVEEYDYEEEDEEEDDLVEECVRRRGVRRGVGRVNYAESDEDEGVISSVPLTRGATEEPPAAHGVASAVGAGVAVDATAEAALKAAEAAHKESTARLKKEVADALEAKKTAGKNRDNARSAKEATRGLPCQDVKEEEWKAAVAQFKENEAQCKEARERAKAADEARKEAWSMLVKARQDANASASAARQAASRAFHSSHHTLISAPKQASEGLEPWKGCKGVTNVRLPSAKLPPLDGHDVVATDDTRVPFKPVLYGATVLVAGTGGMKTVRTLDFFGQPVEPELEQRVSWDDMWIRSVCQTDLVGTSMPIYHLSLSPHASTSRTSWRLTSRSVALMSTSSGYGILQSTKTVSS